MLYKIVMTSGWTDKDMYTGLTEREAWEICEGYGWEYCDENSFVWDLTIVEDESGY